ncbi:MAG TPA: amino acid ABC transporter permease [Casimicrobiaceae bacterium]|nr:amino acid ABC transporter permease [Casimicrobiaceae bacterium]
MNWNLDWNVFFQETPGGGDRYIDLLISGVEWTLLVSVCAWAIAMLVGSIVGTVRTTQNPWLVRIGNFWVELFRNIPLLVQMFLWYFVIPEFIPPLKSWMVKTDPIYAQFVSAVLCLGLFTSARIAEQVRAGIQSLPRGQRNAGLAMGLTQWQVYRFVLLPMAFRIIVPPLTSETMNLIKNSSIALTIGLAELTFRSREIGEYTFRFFEAFSAATIIYIVIAMTANRVMAFVERRVAVPGFIAAGAGGH